ncbi:DUF421 domain-containing protein [Anditalea andensis]|uniref:YetF C-terminal domain-containing protein n=1 Tax=Anditalea andensis TaxID=1048983 RepID=A0A074L502_9BACT|nr:YetF domain-containing protein [Anditalea andensis]KEO75550.1 hypothetical protein EL17_00205 [Anditalea andensis]
MYTSDAELWDWMRILMGGVPAVFLIEVLIRILFIYLLLVVSMRLMGKRMSAIISRNEMIAMISLAAAIGIPIQDPEQGLIPPVIIAAVVISMQRIISTKSMDKPGLEQTIVGDIGIMVRDGKLDIENMRNSRISRERLFTEFRVKGVISLGKVQRAYLEANGSFTIYLHENVEKEGLCILPDWDQDYLEELHYAEGTFACTRCGHLEKSQSEPTFECSHCHNSRWVKAVIA